MSETATGIDLARVAFQAARAAAKTRPVKEKRRPKRTTHRPRDGRDPMGLGPAIDRMMAERGWDDSAQAGSIITKWPEIFPNFEGKAVPVHYDPDTRTLHVKPASPTYSRGLSLQSPSIINSINKALSKPELVRHLKILSPGYVESAPAPRRSPESAPPLPTRVGQPPEHRPRDPRYLQTMAVYREHQQDVPKDSALAVADARQTRMLRQHREPAELFKDAVWAQQEADDLASQRRPVAAESRTVEDSRRAALHRKRTEQDQTREDRRP